MRLKILVFLSLLLLPLSLGAQTASDYLNRSSQKYVFGDEDAARADIEEAERKFPNDPAIKKLSELLHKKKPPQNQNDQNQNQDQNQKQKQQQQQKAKNNNQKNQSPTPTPTPGASPSPNENSPTPTPGESSSPTPTPNDQSGNSPTPSPGEGEAPTPTPGGEGNSPTPTAAPNESPGDSGEPSATPAGTPEKPLTGDVKGAGEENPNEKKNAAIAEAEPEKEGEMSAKHALALVDTAKDEEKKVLLDEHRAQRPVYKDW